MKKNYDDRLIADVGARIHKKKKFGDITYKLFNAYSNTKEAHKKKAELEEWAKKQSDPSLSRRIKPIVYDATWSGKKRYKLYLPQKWFVHLG